MPNLKGNRKQFEISNFFKKFKINEIQYEYKNVPI